MTNQMSQQVRNRVVYEQVKLHVSNYARVRVRRTVRHDLNRAYVQVARSLRWELAA